MLRTNNKRLHANLWTFAHFVGSALVFLLCLSLCVYFTWKSGFVVNPGSELDTELMESNTRLFVNYDDLFGFVNDWVTETSSPIRGLFPLTNFVSFLFGGIIDESIFTLWFYSIGLGLDFALWFNVLLWTLQLIVFVPDACFHWLEKKKED